MSSSLFSHQAERAHQAALRSIARSVEDSAAPQAAAVARDGIAALLRAGSVLCVTGAGVSTDSGIPDYRGPQGSLRRHRPMTYQEFRYDPAARRRYWARSFVGWRRLGEAAPNRAHELLAHWHLRGTLGGLVTQNVDGLHREALQTAGERSLPATGTSSSGVMAGEDRPRGERGFPAAGTSTVELHGNLSTVICLQCGGREDRSHMDVRLEEANPGYAEAAAAAAENVNPDGDVTLDESWVQRFRMVSCLSCGSEELKPDVVYFGENVPAERKAAVEALEAEASALLVVGSSMAVMSGYSIALRMHRAGKPIAVINGGPSRADAKAQWRWRTRIAPALEELDALL